MDQTIREVLRKEWPSTIYWVPREDESFITLGEYLLTP